MMIPKYIADKATYYHKLSEKADKLYHEIEEYLDREQQDIEGVYSFL